MNWEHKICVAPMMDYTDRHCRFFHRLMSPNAFLYTEMINANAVVRGNRKKLLSYLSKKDNEKYMKLIKELNIRG